jgi:hypothetical protein
LFPTYLLDDEDLPLGAILFFVLLVSIAVEVLRLYLHPEGFPGVTRHTLVRVTSVICNVGYHVWAVPPNIRKGMVSAFLGETSMPTVIGIIGTLASDVAAAILTALSRITAPN